jgi:hypothetical protein
MPQTKKERDAMIANGVATAKEHTMELNSGPMQHTIEKQKRLEKRKSKRR